MRTSMPPRSCRLPAPAAMALAAALLIPWTAGAEPVPPTAHEAERVVESLLRPSKRKRDQLGQTFGP